MSETVTLPPESPSASTPTPKAPRAARADYNQKLANDITETATLITNARSNPDVLAALTYSDTEIQEGLALQVAAQTAFADRQRALSAASTIREQRDEVHARVVDEFKAYRTSVQNSLPASAHVALGASGRLPADLQKLVTLVRSAYESAKSPAYLPVLERRKITGAVLASRLADAETLERLDGQFKAADKSATAATAARDAAGDAMRGWLIKFRKQAKSDLRHDPELLAKLGV